MLRGGIGTDTLINGENGQRQVGKLALLVEPIQMRSLSASFGP